MDNAAWLEISLTVNGELAEAVAEVLARYVSGGVVIESAEIKNNISEKDNYFSGPLRVVGYLPTNQRLEENRQVVVRDRANARSHPVHRSLGLGCGRGSRRSWPHVSFRVVPQERNSSHPGDTAAALLRASGLGLGRVGPPRQEKTSCV